MQLEAYNRELSRSGASKHLPTRRKPASATGRQDRVHAATTRSSSRHTRPIRALPTPSDHRRFRMRRKVPNRPVAGVTPFRPGPNQPATFMLWLARRRCRGGALLSTGERFAANVRACRLPLTRLGARSPRHPTNSGPGRAAQRLSSAALRHRVVFDVRTR